MNFKTLLEFHQNLWEEVENNEARDEVLNYYKNIKKQKNQRWFYAFNWACRVENLVKEIKPNSFVLDAGCGVGTEAILAAFCGARVLGVDLRENFIKTMVERKNLYEKKLGKPLNLFFENKNIFELTYQKNFDIIWCMESISHIFPTEDFFKKAFSLLKKGGKLIISDTNALNPINHLELIKKCGLKRSKIAMIEGRKGKKNIEWNEKIWIPHQLIKILKKYGFMIKNLSFSLFFPRSFYQSKKAAIRIYRIEKMINKFPLIKNLGAVYTITTAKI